MGFTYFNQLLCQHSLLSIPFYFIIPLLYLLPFYDIVTFLISYLVIGVIFVIIYFIPENKFNTENYEGRVKSWWMCLLHAIGIYYVLAVLTTVISGKRQCSELARKVTTAVTK